MNKQTFNQNFDGDQLFHSILTAETITAQGEVNFHCDIALPGSDGTTSFEIFGNAHKTYIIDRFTGETFLIDMNITDFDEQFLIPFAA